MPEEPRALDRAEAGVTGSCELPVVESNQGPLQDQCILSTTGLSLQPAKPLYLATGGSYTVPWADLLFCFVHIGCVWCKLKAQTLSAIRDLSSIIVPHGRFLLLQSRV